MHTDTPRTQSGTQAAVVIDVPAPAVPAAAERTPASRRALRAAAALVTWIVLGLAVAALATVTLGPRLGLFQVETVLSGSMQPVFEPGDLLVVVPEPLSAVRAGQVLSFHAPTPDHRVETHRVVRVINPGLHPVIVTKGDANAAPDPWRARLHGATAWRMVAVVPHAGAADPHASRALGAPRGRPARPAPARRRRAALDLAAGDAGGGGRMRPWAVALAVACAVVVAGSATAFAAFSRTAAAAQTVSSRTLGPASGLTGAASGHDVNLSWTAGSNGSGYAIAAAANGTSTNCTAASYSALTTTAGTSVIDTGRFTPQGTVECYRVTTTYGTWSSQAGNPTLAVRLGVVAVSADLQDGRRTGRIDPGDTITIVFNQPISPASGPIASNSICTNTNGTVMLGVTGSGTSCPTTSATTVGTLTGLSVNRAARFDASYAWSAGNTVLTVTIDARSAGQNVRVSGTAVYTPTTTATGLLSQTGSFHACSSNTGGGNCTPSATGDF